MQELERTSWESLMLAAAVFLKALGGSLYWEEQSP